MGGSLAGVEDGSDRSCLVVGDGGLVTHFTGREDAGIGLFDLSSRDRRQWLEAMDPIEPLYFVRHAAPSALYFQSGTMDEAVPPPDARAFQRAASEPKLVDWYRSGHLLPEQATCDQLAWLETRPSGRPGALLRDHVGWAS